MRSGMDAVSGRLEADGRIHRRASCHKFVGIGLKLHEYEAFRTDGKHSSAVEQKPASECFGTTASGRLQTANARGSRVGPGGSIGRSVLSRERPRLCPLPLPLRARPVLRSTSGVALFPPVLAPFGALGGSDRPKAAARTHDGLLAARVVVDIRNLRSVATNSPPIPIFTDVATNDSPNGSRSTEISTGARPLRNANPGELWSMSNTSAQEHSS